MIPLRPNSSPSPTARQRIASRDLDDTLDRLAAEIDGATKRAANPKIVARITGIQSAASATPLYSWEFAVAVADGEATRDTAGFRSGGFTDLPAWESSGNPRVPTDGSAVVELWPSAGGLYYSFTWPAEWVPARVVASAGTAHAWEERALGAGGTQTNLAGGRAGSTTVNPAYERGGAADIPAGTEIWIYRGAAAAPDVTATIITHGNGSSVHQVQHVVVSSATGGPWTITAVNAAGVYATTAALAWNINAAALQTALRLLAGFGACTVTGAGTSGSPFVVTMLDTFADLAALVGDPFQLAGVQEWWFDAPGIVGDQVINDQVNWTINAPVNWTLNDVFTWIGVGIGRVVFNVITNFVQYFTWQGVVFTNPTNNTIIDPGDAPKIRIVSATDITILGFSGGVDGRVLIIESAGPGKVTLADQDATALAVDAAVTCPLPLPYTIHPDCNVILEYDGTTGVKWWKFDHQVVGASGTASFGGPWAYACNGIRFLTGLDFLDNGDGTIDVSAAPYVPPFPEDWKRAIIQPAADGSSTLLGVGTTNPATAGSAGTVMDPRGQWFALTTAAFNLSSAYVNSGTMVHLDQGFVATWIVEFPAAADFGAGNNSRVWIVLTDGGMTAATLAAQDTLNNLNGIGFRLSSGTADVNWMVVRNDGNAAAQAAIDSGIVVAALTKYVLQIDARNPASIDVKVNGTTVTTLAANLPATATRLAMLAQVTTLAAAAKTLRFGLYRQEYSC